VPGVEPRASSTKQPAPAPSDLSTGGLIGHSETAGGSGPLARVLARSLRSDSLVFRIAKDIGAEIIVGALAPGAPISSVDVARRYGTSRAPVRDALLVLEREGLLTTSVGRASRVRHIALAELRDIYEVRAKLYALVAERCVRFASDEQIAHLRRLNNRLVTLARSGDLNAYFWANLDFRDEEATIAGNERLRQILDALGLQTLVTRYAGLAQPERLAASVTDHDVLLGAYETRNVELAVAISHTIVLRSLETIERFKWGGIAPG
jgi:DNA-binding GntR family transcriptional regulator